MKLNSIRPSLSLDIVISIIMKICNQDLPYDSTVQELIYLGMEIIYESQMTKNNISTFKDNIDE